ncbi:MAG: DinB family protein, partial [Gemmatimonadota bacterium]|nr:DinB family protein [Gemmatimonadota bacterium]
EHIAHLTLTDRPYFPPIRAALDGERASGRSAEGPFKGGMLGNWFARMLEPPPRRRLKTAKKLEPPRELRREEVSADFVACRDELLALMRAADGLDLDRARLRSPFLALLKMPVSSAFAVLLAHGRRHIWIAREGLSG